MVLNPLFKEIGEKHIQSILNELENFENKNVLKYKDVLLRNEEYSEYSLRYKLINYRILIWGETDSSNSQFVILNLPDVNTTVGHTARIDMLISEDEIQAKELLLSLINELVADREFYNIKKLRIRLNEDQLSKMEKILMSFSFIREAFFQSEYEEKDIYQYCVKI